MAALKTVSIEEIFNIPEKPVLSYKEIEEAGIMRKHTAYRMVKNGELEALRIGGKVFIPRKALIAWLESNLTVKG